jgi:hypothetical protein
MDGIQYSLARLTTNPGASKKTEAVDLKGSEIAADKTIAKYQEAVVKIVGEVKDPKSGEVHQIKIGSGVVVSPDGLLVSAAHVGSEECPADLKFLARFKEKHSKIKALIEQKGLQFYAEVPSLSSSGEVSLKRIPMTILKKGKYQDVLVASLNMDKSDLASAPHVQISPSATQFGSLVYTIGHPGGCDHNVLTAGNTFNGSLESMQKEKKIFEGIDSIARFLGSVTGSQKIADFSESLTRKRSELDMEIAGMQSHGDPKPGELISSTNQIKEGNSGGLLASPEGKLIGVTIAGGARGLNPLPFLMGRDENIRAVSEPSPRLISFIQQELPEIDLDKLMIGEEVGTQNLLRQKNN